MADKPSHLGMAGQFASMSEFLIRGYNVAAPVVDIGDDIYVVDDGEGVLYRVQVKTADASARPLTFTLSRKQLTTPKKSPLYYMLLTYVDQRWRYILIHQEKLRKIRRNFETVRASAIRDGDARSDALTIKVAIRDDYFELWGERLPTNAWPDAEFPPLRDGPGAKKRAAPPARDP